MRKVSVVTVNFNQALVTEDLLKSLSLNNQYPETEIIVIDNGSTPNPVPAWEKKFPHICFIRSDINLGFAGGNNLGIKKSGGDYLFLINNDTEVTADLIPSLVDLLDKQPKVGAVSPKIRFHQQPETLQYAGFTPMNYFTARNVCIGYLEKDTGQYDKFTGKTGFMHGAAMMIRKEAIDRAGLMPENFFLYYEEMDWCEQIKKAGYEIWVQPKALIYHKESISVGKKSPLKEFFMTRNRILFIRRNASALEKLIFYFHFAFLVMPRNMVVYFKSGRTDLLKQFLKAIWWNISHNASSSDLGFPIHKLS